MRILVFGVFANKVTGQDTFLLNMRNNMSENCIFDFVVIGHDCIHKEKIKKLGGEIYYVREYWTNPIGYLLDIFSICKMEKATHSVAYINLFSMVHATPIIVCKLLGYKIVLHSHNSSLTRYRTLHNINKRIFGYMKNVIRLACSQVAADFMYRKKAEWILIHNAVDTDRFKYDIEKRKEIRTKYNIENKFVVGFVGRLEMQKNPLFLIDILSKYKRKDTMFLIIGEGALKQSMIDKARENAVLDKIIFLDNTPNIHYYYSAMDVLVLPSLYEGLSIVLVEAQSVGIPCIISSEGVSKETIINSKIVKSASINGNCEDWIKAIDSYKASDINKIWCNKVVENSQYNIKKEAIMLEKILTSL